MVLYKIMVSFNPWRLRLMKCGVKSVCAHCVKFRHTEVYIIKVPPSPALCSPENTRALRQHNRVKGPTAVFIPFNC